MIETFPELERRICLYKALRGYAILNSIDSFSAHQRLCVCVLFSTWYLANKGVALPEALLAFLLPKATGG